MVEDLGSGHLGALPDHPLDAAEPSVRASVAAGLAICCFSGDKLLGGPQAGIIVGRKPHVDAIRRHPLMRALRVDKLTYAALDATLAEYAAGRGRAVPIQRMLTMGAEAIRARAEALAAVIRKAAGWKADVVRGMSAVGGGSAPGIDLPTWLVALARDGVSAAPWKKRCAPRPPLSSPASSRTTSSSICERSSLKTDELIAHESLQRL